MLRRSVFFLLVLLLACCLPAGRAADPAPASSEAAAADEVVDTTYWFPVSITDAEWTWLDTQNNRYPIERLFPSSPTLFRDGLACVRVTHPDDPGTTYGAIIDSTGKTLAEAPKVRFIMDLGNGHFLIEHSIRGSFSRLDRDGTLTAFPDLASLITLQWNIHAIRPMPAVSRSKELSGYVNDRLEWVIPPLFKTARPFGPDGLARVELPNGAWRYIDPTGKVILNSPYPNPGDFSEGLASFTLGELNGYMDLNGETVIPPQFTTTRHFEDGSAFVQVAKSNDWILIDRTGKTVATLGESAQRVSHSIVWHADHTDTDIISSAVDLDGRVLIEPKPRIHVALRWAAPLVLIFPRGLTPRESMGIGVYNEATRTWVRPEGPLPPLPPTMVPTKPLSAMFRAGPTDRGDTTGD